MLRTRPQSRCDLGRLDLSGRAINTVYRQVTRECKWGAVDSLVVSCTCVVSSLRCRRPELCAEVAELAATGPQEPASAAGPLFAGSSAITARGSHLRARQRSLMRNTHAFDVRHSSCISAACEAEAAFELLQVVHLRSPRPRGRADARAAQQGTRGKPRPT